MTLSFVPGRFLVVSDIHSNIEALEAVLRDAEGSGPFEKVLCPGDVVGYGPDPDLVIERLQSLSNLIVVQGNHDEAVSTGSTPGFRPMAHDAVGRNRRQLREEHFAWLGGLKNAPLFDLHQRFALVHGNFDGDNAGRNAFQNMYTSDRDEAYASLAKLSFQNGTIQVPLGIFGHTHVPTLVTGTVQDSSTARARTQRANFDFMTADTIPPDIPFNAQLFEPRDQSGTETRYKVLFNPGSVGQPRNRSSCAHYGIVDFTIDKFVLMFRRVEYDVASVQQKLKDRNYHPDLAGRLLGGR